MLTDVVVVVIEVFGMSWRDDVVIVDGTFDDDDVDDDVDDDALAMVEVRLVDVARVTVDVAVVEVEDDAIDGTTRSTPGTIAAGTGGVAGSGDVGSLVGNRGARTSGSLV